MYGLMHKHIRIEDQQLNLKINIMVDGHFEKEVNISVTLIKLFLVVAVFCEKLFENNVSL